MLDADVNRRGLPTFGVHVLLYGSDVFRVPSRVVMGHDPNSLFTDHHDP